MAEITDAELDRGGPHVCEPGRAAQVGYEPHELVCADCYDYLVAALRGAREEIERLRREGREAYAAGDESWPYYLQEG